MVGEREDYQRLRADYEGFLSTVIEHFARPWVRHFRGRLQKFPAVSDGSPFSMFAVFADARWPQPEPQNRFRQKLISRCGALFNNSEKIVRNV